MFRIRGDETGASAPLRTTRLLFGSAFNLLYVASPLHSFAFTLCGRV